MARPRRTDQINSADMPSRIKAAARRQMAEQGTAGLSLLAIARELGITAPAIYNYFPRLDDLITALSGRIRMPACDVAAWKMWGISMAGWNAIISGGLALFSLISSMRRKSDRGWQDNVLR